MSVKVTIVLSEEHPQFHAALRRRGMHTLAVRRCDLLDSPVASHADMQLLALDTKTVLLSPYQPQLKAQLSQLSLTVLAGPALEKEYPESAGAFRTEQVAKDERGKPYLAGYPDIHISLSHSGRLAACAVAKKPVGVDVELRKMRQNRERVAR